MARLTQKQNKFADRYIETGNGVQSALEVYDTEDYSTAGVIAHENLKKPKIQEYLTSKAERAAEIVFSIAEHGESDEVRLKASKDILDRAGYKAIEKSVTISVEVEATEEIKAATKILSDYAREHGSLPSVGASSSTMGSQAQNKDGDRTTG